MGTATACYVEHVAIRVLDIGWHIRFFRDVLGMDIRDRDGPADAPRQVWTFGGIQLIADPDLTEPVACFGHIGVMAEDAEAVIAAALAFGRISHLGTGRNWLVLPDGIVVEILQASPGAVAAARAIDPRQ
jgi:catechol 2,3-dioxygenase-like lactoylglutathione lyase family enzyme